MCGFLFLDQVRPGQISSGQFRRVFDRQQWRGPDAHHVISFDDDRVLMGHHRLSILDPVPLADQPMASRCGRYVIAYNGEIYNHLTVRKKIDIPFRTHCDTETVLEGFVQLGRKIFELIEGMFALVIYDKVTGNWTAARDRFGIKPLFLHRGRRGNVIGSESAGVADLAGATPCPLSLQEWRLVRRPLPGKSFFSGVEEVPLGSIVERDGSVHRYWRLSPSFEPFSQDRFNHLLTDSIRLHELSDVKNVSLLSGGLDSAVITAVSGVSRCYTVGLPANNEFAGASETSDSLGRELQKVEIGVEELMDTWRELARIRREPLGLPNEGLIYAVCNRMECSEKVVLTGEGADELLFGYDGIFRWYESRPWLGAAEFLSRYGYSDKVAPTKRLADYVDALHFGKSNLEFAEDFFYGLHLPGLLRRMDFASMAASKEARVPFVSQELVGYMYRRPFDLKIAGEESKLPLRVFAKKLGLEGALRRRKIGFSADLATQPARYSEYETFQNIVLGALGWS